MNRISGRTGMGRATAARHPGASSRTAAAEAALVGPVATGAEAGAAED